MTWQPYLDDRLIERRDGFVVIKPVDTTPVVPLCCPLCDTVMRSRDDEEAYEGFGCCHFCALTWAHPRRQAWADGWRPTPDQVRQAQEQRPPLKLVLVIE